MDSRTYKGLVANTVNEILLIGHRGSPLKAPENTLLSFEHAHREGAAMVEMDLMLTCDDVVVVHHDDTLERMIGISQGVQEVDWKTIQRAPIQSSQALDQMCFIPSLAEVLSEFKGKLSFYLEIKSEKLNDTDCKKLIELSWKEVCDLEMEDHVFFASFDNRVLKFSKKVRCSRVGLIVENNLPKESEIKECDILSVSFNLASTLGAEKLHSFERPIIVWDVHKKEEVELLKSWKVAGICLDELNLF